MIRKHRNDIAHELPKYVGTGENNVDIELFTELYGLLSKVDRWWFMNVELAIDPDIARGDVDEEGIQLGNMLTLQIISRVLLGEDADFDELRESLKNKLRNQA